MDPKPCLPAIIYDTPFIREANVRTDLERIARDAVEQNVTNQHATALAEQLIIERQLHAIPPEAREIHTLVEALRAQIDSSKVDEEQTNEPLTLRKAARLLTGSDSDAATVDRRIISLDMLSATHSDTTDSQQNDHLYKVITDSRAASDIATEQGTYAAFIAADSIQPNLSRTIESLELARYKAHVALEASRGKFSSKEQADEWAVREKRLMPTHVRAGILLELHEIFIHTHNGENGVIILDAQYAPQIKDSLQTVTTVLRDILGHATRLRETLFNSEVFDKQLPNVVDSLQSLVESYLAHGKARGDASLDFAMQLEELACCKVSDTQTLGRAVLNTIALLS